MSCGWLKSSGLWIPVLFGLVIITVGIVLLATSDGGEPGRYAGIAFICMGCLAIVVAFCFQRDMTIPRTVFRRQPAVITYTSPGPVNGPQTTYCAQPQTMQFGPQTTQYGNPFPGQQPGQVYNGYPDNTAPAYPPAQGMPYGNIGEPTAQPQSLDVKPPPPEAPPSYSEVAAPSAPPDISQDLLQNS